MRNVTSRSSSFIRRRGLDLGLNVAALTVLWLVYRAVRGITADQFTSATTNAVDLMTFQADIGLPSEQSLQQGLLHRTRLLRGANIYYVALHFPATLAFLSWVWLHHRHCFARVRNTLIGVTSAGLVVHIAFPLAPPRMIDGFVDTAARIGPNAYDLEMSHAANQIAAMPSLHVAWALMVALGTIWILETRWRLLVLLHPLLTAAVVVITANHYWTDVIVAAALVWLWWVGIQPPTSSDRVVTITDPADHSSRNLSPNSVSFPTARGTTPLR